jgi:uncharacterized protein (DUF2062 family)
MDIQDLSLTARSRRMRSALRRAYERFIRIRGDPKDICFGLALGIFLGISPLFGFQLILAVLIAALLKWNKIAAAMGTLISNPLTTPFIYPFAYFVGSSVMGTTTRGHLVIPRDLATAGRMLEEAPHLLLALTLGTVLIGLPLAVLGYFLSYAALIRYRETIKEKLNKRKQKLVLRKERFHERSSRLKEKFGEKVASRRKRNRLTGRSKKRTLGRTRGGRSN